MATKKPTFQTKISPNLEILINQQKGLFSQRINSPTTKLWIRRISKLLLKAIVIMFIVFTLTFTILYYSGSTPGLILNLGNKVPEAVQASLMYQFHLTTSPAVGSPSTDWLQRYCYALTDFFSSSMGLSWTYGIPVSQILWPSFSISMQIGIFSFALSIMFGIPLGIFLARRQNFASEMFSGLATVFAFSLPSFVVGLVLVYFSYLANLPTIFDFGNWYVMFIAAAAIAIPVGFGYSRYLRGSIREEYEQQYVKLARLKGLTERRVLWGHVFKPSMYPIINYLPLLMIGILVGSITVEQVFGIPGAGYLMISSALYGDQTMLLSIVTIYTFLTVLAFFIRDISLPLIDPRLKT